MQTNTISDSITKALLAGGAAAGLIFTIVWLIAGSSRTDYNPMRHAISSLFFLGVPIASFVFTRFFSRSGQRGAAAYSVLTRIGMLVVFTVARPGFRLPPGSFDLLAYFGVLQRIVVSTGMLWLTWLAITILRVRTETPAAATA